MRGGKDRRGEERRHGRRLGRRERAETRRGRRGQEWNRKEK